MAAAARINRNVPERLQPPHRPLHRPLALRFGRQRATPCQVSKVPDLANSSALVRS